MQTKTKTITAISFFTLLLSSACRSVQISDHIRTYDNDSLIYKFTKDNSGSVSAYYDTLICKMIVRRGVLPNDLSKNQVLFYFEKTNNTETAARDIFTSDVPVNQFTYCIDRGHLYVSHNISRNLNPVFAPLTKVIPQQAKLKKIYVYKSGDYRRCYTLLQKEAIVWGTIPINDVLKVSVSFNSRNGIKTTDTVWLAKMGVGSVEKKRRVCGTTTALINRYPIQ